MIRRPPRSTRTDTSFPTRRSSDLTSRNVAACPPFSLSQSHHCRPLRRDCRGRGCAPFGVIDHSTPCGGSREGSDGGAWFSPRPARPGMQRPYPRRRHVDPRSEEHTSELQSLMRISYAVFCLKKKKNRTAKTSIQ